MSIDINDNEINVETIMEQIRETINKKKRLGLYNDEETGMVSELRLLPGQNNYEDLEDYLSVLNSEWDPKGEETITSHRRILGPFIIFIKKVIRKILKPLKNTILQQQTEFNLQLVNLINSIVPQIKAVINKYDELTEKHEDLLNRHSELLDRHSEPEKRYEELENDIGN